MAFRASLHRTEIGLLERGGRLPRVDTLAKLAGALGVEPGALFDGITWTPGDVRRGQFKPDDPRYALSMAKQSKKPADLNRLAASIVDEATNDSPPDQDQKDPAAVP